MYLWHCVFFGGNYRLEKFILTTWRVCKFFSSIVFCFKRQTDTKQQKKYRKGNDAFLGTSNLVQKSNTDRDAASTPALVFVCFFSIQHFICYCANNRSSSNRCQLYIRIASAFIRPHSIFNLSVSLCRCVPLYRDQFCLFFLSLALVKLQIPVNE